MPSIAIEMVFAQVETRGHVRRRAMRVVSSWKLDSSSTNTSGDARRVGVVSICEQRIEHRQADIAGHDGAQSRRAAHRAGHLGHRALAVGAGDRQHLGAANRRATPERTARCRRPRERRAARAARPAARSPGTPGLMAIRSTPAKLSALERTGRHRHLRQLARRAARCNGGACARVGDAHARACVRAASAPSTGRSRRGRAPVRFSAVHLSSAPFQRRESEQDEIM